MGFSFRKSFKLSSGIKLNLSKKNISASFGGKGFSINTGTRGTFINASIPSTGISYRSKLFKKGKHHKSKSRSTEVTQPYSALDAAITLGVIIGIAIFIMSNSFLLSLIPTVLLITLYELSENKTI